jgi:hypothetical protein
MKSFKKYLPAAIAASALSLSLALFGTSAALAQDADSSQISQQTTIVGWPSHAHDAQHTSDANVAGQNMNTIHWSTPVDLKPNLEGGELLIHYGSALVTPANTVIVPVKTAVNSFRVEAHNGTNGSLLWKLATNYRTPTSSFQPSFSPVLLGNNLYIQEAGGVVAVRSNPDSPTGTMKKLVFFGAKNYAADPSAYTQNVLINTPITADSQGNIFFGFIVQGSTPINLQSGLARISSTGVGTWVAASTAANDPSISKVDMNCGPALSADEKTLYVGVNTFDFGYGYLLAMDTTTLATNHAVRLKDPSSGMDASIPDASSATPTVGPDGDVYFGVLENPFPDHNDRGWLLHFDSTLTVTKTPGSFGWDDTASIVAASLVPSYRGRSTYLVMTKYNNYAEIGTGNGVNKVAVLDPDNTENDPIIPTTKVMKEVLTIKGVTPDPDFPNLPGAVREWCINSAAVDPVTKSIMVNSEDGYMYRWDLTTNSFSQKIKLSQGIGEAYTPTEMGPDGTIYGINDAILDAIGQ